jgi:RNA polymerase sigma-70 factor, ECF subfamily
MGEPACVRTGRALIQWGGRPARRAAATREMTHPPESEWSNLDWLTALRADSDQAWAAIRQRVLRSLRVYLRGRGKALADHDVEALAEDAVQDTLLAVRAKLDTFRNESRFTTWVHRIAVNAVLGHLRQRRWNARSPETVGDAIPDSLTEEDVPAPERAVLQRELWALVRQLIEVELTPHQRTILLAHVFHRKPLDLLAAELGTSRDAVYKAIHDARRKLRAALLARGVTVAEAVAVFGQGGRP